VDLVAEEKGEVAEMPETARLAAVMAAPTVEEATAAAQRAESETCSVP